MTTTTPLPALDRRRDSNRRAFSLVELLVATTLGAIIMGAILSSFLFMARAGLSLQYYSDLETQARNAIETFAQDVRIASDVTWNSQNSITLTTAASSGGGQVTYIYNPANGTFTRQQISPAVGPVLTLISGISTFEFTAYSIATNPVDLTNLVAAGNNTKQIQISLRAERTHATLNTATNKVISARFILRNKRVTA